MSTDTENAQSHADTVSDIYEAFGRGDVEAILERLAEDVEWEAWDDSYAQRAGVPWMERRNGREAVRGFFELIGRFEISEFSVRDMLASDKQVVCEVCIAVKLPGGGSYRDEELHLWTFDDDGRVVRLRHYTDTAKHIAAAGGEPAA